VPDDVCYWHIAAVHEQLPARLLSRAKRKFGGYQELDVSYWG